MGRGGRLSRIDLEWKAEETTMMPWQPNSFDPDSNTLDFCFKPTPEMLHFLANLETEVLAQVTKDRELYLGAGATPEKVRATFQSNLKMSQKGMEHLKCKGRYANLKFWDKNSKPTPPPTIWGSDDQYQLRATGLWFNDKGWGVGYDLKHLKIFAIE